MESEILDNIFLNSEFTLPIELLNLEPFTYEAKVATRLFTPICNLNSENLYDYFSKKIASHVFIDGTHII